MLAAVVGAQLVLLRCTLSSVAYLDDAAIHEQMVRFATQSFKRGRDPLTSWYPFLNEGSPQFVHYQPLAALVTGAVGLLVGPDRAFRWSLYLLLCLWPLVIWSSARLLRLGRVACLAAAVVSPLLMSVPKVGYESGAYLWIGYGLWAQLWASMTLPFAWALSWRSMSDRRLVLPAALAVATTACLHFETGYLSFLSVAVAAIVSNESMRRRVGTAAMTLLLALSMSAWVIAPVLAQRSWAAINEPLQRSPDTQGYGIGEILSWTIRGQLFDDHRAAVLTVAMLLGLAGALFRSRMRSVSLYLTALGTLSLLLAAGPTTFGGLARWLPGGRDVYFRRFMLGIQLSGIYLAGSGIEWLFEKFLIGGRRFQQALGAAWPAELGAVSVLVAGGVVVLAGLTPAALQVYRYEQANTRAVHAQQRAVGATERIQALIDVVEAHPVGRVFAGLPGTWADSFDVGSVPVYKYLASEDIDEVGFTLRTASLMGQPEFWFDDANPSDYIAFGVRYLILPVGMAPPVLATNRLTSGPYRLWTLPYGYLSAVTVQGTYIADKATVGVASRSFLASDLAASHRGLVIRWDGGRVPTAACSSRSSLPIDPGRVISDRVALTSGRAVADVSLNRCATVVLSASYDPGWKVSVDGHAARTVMMAPAAVGVVVGAGFHRVEFRYEGVGYYPQLWTAAVLALLIGAWVSWGRRPNGRVSGARSGESSPPRCANGSDTIRE